MTKLSGAEKLKEPNRKSIERLLNSYDAGECHRWETGEVDEAYAQLKSLHHHWFRVEVVK